MTNIEELTKMMFEFEQEMEIYSELMANYWNQHREFERMSKEAETKHRDAQVDYKEAARQYHIIKNQLKEALALKDK